MIFGCNDSLSHRYGNDSGWTRQGNSELITTRWVMGDGDIQIHSTETEHQFDVGSPGTPCKQQSKWYVDDRHMWRDLACVLLKLLCVRRITAFWVRAIPIFFFVASFFVIQLSRMQQAAHTHNPLQKNMKMKKKTKRKKKKRFYNTHRLLPTPSSRSSEATSEEKRNTNATIHRVSAVH